MFFCSKFLCQFRQKCYKMHLPRSVQLKPCMCALHLVFIFWVKSVCQIPCLKYTSFLLVTILVMVTAHPVDGGWPSMALRDWSSAYLWPLTGLWAYIGLTNLKNWKKNLEKLEKNLEKLEFFLKNWTTFGEENWYHDTDCMEKICLL